MHVKKDAAEKSFIRGFSVYVAKGCEYSNYRKWNRQQKEKEKLREKKKLFQTHQNGNRQKPINFD